MLHSVVTAIPRREEEAPSYVRCKFHHQPHHDAEVHDAEAVHADVNERKETEHLQRIDESRATGKKQHVNRKNMKAVVVGSTLFPVASR